MRLGIGAIDSYIRDYVEVVNLQNYLQNKVFKVFASLMKDNRGVLRFTVLPVLFSLW